MVQTAFPVPTPDTDPEVLRQALLDEMDRWRISENEIARLAGVEPHTVRVFCRPPQRRPAAKRWAPLPRWYAAVRQALRVLVLRAARAHLAAWDTVDYGAWRAAREAQEAAARAPLEQQLSQLAADPVAAL